MTYDILLQRGPGPDSDFVECEINGKGTGGYGVWKDVGNFVALTFTASALREIADRLDKEEREEFAKQPMDPEQTLAFLGGAC